MKPGSSGISRPVCDFPGKEKTFYYSTFDFVVRILFFKNQFSFCLYVPIFRRSSTDCSTNLLILYDLLIEKCIQMYILCVIKIDK